MYETNVVLAANPRAVGYSMRGGSKMQADHKTEQADSAQSEARRLAEIDEIVNNSEYRPERAFGKDVILFSPSALTTLSQSGNLQALIHSDNAVLKKDIAKVLEKYSLAERRIIFRVLVQGHSIEGAIKRSRTRNARSTHRWLSRVVIPDLQHSLSDYYENGKVVL